MDSTEKYLAQLQARYENWLRLEARRQIRNHKVLQNIEQLNENCCKLSNIVDSLLNGQVLNALGLSIFMLNSTNYMSDNEFKLNCEESKHPDFEELLENYQQQFEILITPLFECSLNNINSVLESTDDKPNI